MMKIYFVGLAILLLTSEKLLGQNNDWREIANMDGVSIQSRTADCADPVNGIFNDYLLLKVVNGNDHAVNVTFDRLAWFDDQCNACKTPSEEHRTKMLLEANAAQEGSCASRDIGLKVFSKMHDQPKVAKLTRFEVGQLSIIRQTSAR